MLEQLKLNIEIKSKLNSRQKALKEIITWLEKENAEIEDNKIKFKKVNPRLIAIRTSHLSINDLYYTHSICKNYKQSGKGAYGKCFWGSLKVKK